MAESSNAAAWVAAIAAVIGTAVMLFKAFSYLVSTSNKVGVLERDIASLKRRLQTQSQEFQERIKSSETKTRLDIVDKSEVAEEVRHTIQDHTAALIQTVNKIETAIGKLWQANQERSNDITEISTKLGSLFDQIRDQLRDMEQIVETGSAVMLEVAKLQERFKALEQTLTSVAQNREADQQQLHELDKKVEVIDAQSKTDIRGHQNG